MDILSQLISLHSFYPNVIALYFISLRIVRELIKFQQDAVYDEDEDANSPLHLACFNGHLIVVKALIAANCDVISKLVFT